MGRQRELGESSTLMEASTREKSAMEPEVVEGSIDIKTKYQSIKVCFQKMNTMVVGN